MYINKRDRIRSNEQITPNKTSLNDKWIILPINKCNSLMSYYRITNMLRTFYIHRTV